MFGRLKKFIAFRSSIAEPPYEWDLDSVLIFSERRVSALLEERGEILGKYNAGNAQGGREISPGHLAGFPPEFSKFQKIAGLVSLGDTDLRIINIEPADWVNAYQRHKRQAKQINVSVLERRGGLIVDKIADISDGILAPSFRAAVSSGLRGNDLLNTAPSTLALTIDRHVGFAGKQNAAKFEGGIGE